MVAVILVTIGAILSIKNFNNSFSNYHQQLGIGLYAIVWFQALLGFLRPPRYFCFLFFLFSIINREPIVFCDEIITIIILCSCVCI